MKIMRENKESEIIRIFQIDYSDQVSCFLTLFKTLLWLMPHSNDKLGEKRLWPAFTSFH